MVSGDELDIRILGDADRADNGRHKRRT
jgi:hypothetical protein